MSLNSDSLLTYRFKLEAQANQVSYHIVRYAIIHPPLTAIDRSTRGYTQCLFAMTKWITRQLIERHLQLDRVGFSYHSEIAAKNTGIVAFGYEVCFLSLSRGEKCLSLGLRV